MATMATQGPWLKIASVSQPKSVAKSTELGFLTSQLSGVRISHGYYSDVINRIAVPSAPSLQTIVALWWEAGKRFVKLRLSTKALKTIEKNGLDAVSKKAGIDLRKK